MILGLMTASLDGAEGSGNTLYEMLANEHRIREALEEENNNFVPQRSQFNLGGHPSSLTQQQAYGD